MYGQDSLNLSNGEIVGIIIGVITTIAIQAFIAYKFQNIAIMKGHSNIHAFAWCFFLGIYGCIYIAALPNVASKSTAKNISENKPTNNTAYNRYTCKSIVKTEKTTSGSCFACHEFHESIPFCKIEKEIGITEFPICEKCFEQYTKNAKK